MSFTFPENSPFLNSDVLINALVMKKSESLSKLRSEVQKLDLSKGERFIISDLVMNDVMTAAQVKQMPTSDIFSQLSSPSAYYFPFLAPKNYVERAYVVMFQRKELCLTFTDWVTLWIMHDSGNNVLISDKKEIDEVIIHKDFKEYFRNIRRV